MAIQIIVFNVCFYMEISLIGDHFSMKLHTNFIFCGKKSNNNNKRKRKLMNMEEYQNK